MKHAAILILIGLFSFSINEREMNEKYGRRPDSIFKMGLEKYISYFHYFIDSNLTKSEALQKMIDHRDDFENLAEEIFKNGDFSLFFNNLKIKKLSLKHNVDCLIPEVNFGQGIFCLNKKSKNNHFVVAPHPVVDQDTDILAVNVFEKIKAKYLFISSINRCSFESFSNCTGSTSACGKSEQYRKSDLAHNDDNFLFYLTKSFKNNLEAGVQIQIHGCGEKSCPTKGPNPVLLRLSQGGKNVLPDSALPNRIKAKFENLLLKKKINGHVLSCHKKGELNYKLCATTNAQGRLLNDSVEDACHEFSTPNENSRFLHIEANRDLRERENIYDKVKPKLLLKILSEEL